MPLPAALPAPGVPGGPRLAAVLGRAALEAATAGSTLDPGRGLRVVLIASLGTVIGAAAVLLPAARSPRALSASLGLGCGAMLWAALAEIVPEARAALGGQAGDPGHPPPSPYAVNLTVLAWFLLGVGLVVLLEALSERVLSNTEEATDPESNLAEIDEHGILRPASFADTTPSRVSSSTCAGDATSAQVASTVQQPSTRPVDLLTRTLPESGSTVPVTPNPSLDGFLSSSTGADIPTPGAELAATPGPACGGCGCQWPLAARASALPRSRSLLTVGGGSSLSTILDSLESEEGDDAPAEASTGRRTPPRGDFSLWVCQCVHMPAAAAAAAAAVAAGSGATDEDDSPAGFSAEDSAPLLLRTPDTNWFVNGGSDDDGEEGMFEMHSFGTPSSPGASARRHPSTRGGPRSRQLSFWSDPLLWMRMDWAGRIDSNGALREPITRDDSLHKTGMASAFAIAFHNLPEGLATCAAAAADIRAGSALAVAVALHNIPEGLCVSQPLYHSTGSRLRGLAVGMLASTSGPLGGLISYLVMVATGVGPPPWLIGGALATVAGAMCAIALGELLPSAFRSLWFPPTTGSSTPEAAAKLTGSSASAGASRHPFGSKDCCKYITCGQCRRSAPVCAAMGASFQPGPACSGACACHNAIAPPPMAESPPAEPAPESGSAPDVPDGGGPQDKSVVLSPLFLSIFLGMALVGFSMVLGELLLS